MSWSPRSCRSAVSAWDTADSLTPSALAAARTEPSRATRTNAFSCVSVTAFPPGRICTLRSFLVQVPAQVEYEKATSVSHALSLLSRYGPEARILAGGHSLIPMMKLRLARPEVLVDINGIEDLRYIRLDGGGIHIGTLARH